MSRVSDQRGYIVLDTLGYGLGLDDDRLTIE